MLYVVSRIHVCFVTAVYVVVSYPTKHVLLQNNARKENGTMKIIAIMPARNEEWVIQASVQAALEWVDEIVVVAHQCTDQTIEQALINTPGSVHVIGASHVEWHDMAQRQQGLELARRLGATHIALIDADEILTANLRPSIRDRFASLREKESFDVQMIVPWHSVVERRADDCVWTRAKITLGFRDDPIIHWLTENGEYDLHRRRPMDVSGIYTLETHLFEGGVFHLQFADRLRLSAKHLYYKLFEHIRWPDRSTVEALNQKYGQALDESDLVTVPIPREWWGNELQHINSSAHVHWFDEIAEMKGQVPMEVYQQLASPHQDENGFL